MTKTTSSRTPRNPAADTPADQEPLTDTGAAPEPDSQDPPPTAAAEEKPATEPDGNGTEPDGPAEQPPGVYEYVHGIGCTYPHIPLTCHAYHPPVDATETAPAIAERAATVFEWLDGPPTDGRWVTTRKKPNQAADNAGGLLNETE